MELYNSLTRQKEAFEPINPTKVGMYTCGPTVYDHISVGNWRTYITSDFLRRALEFNGYSVDFVMNITDVGHLTGDNLGDSSTGVDRMEKASKREGKNAWEIAKYYGDKFQVEYSILNIKKPKIFAKATDHIDEQIELVSKIEKAGFAYKISDGIYFDIKAYEKNGHKYGELSNIDEAKAGARVQENTEKRDPRDFALWKFSPKDTKRDMQWESPWGIGFPGWHVECSAMSQKYLGDQFDIHTGGEDLRSTHHPNEIAQSETACGCSPFVKYWVHGAFLLVNGGKMGRSLGNIYTLDDIKERGLNPLSLRYLFLGGHYRKQQNFTWEALVAANNALKNLYNYFRGWGEKTGAINESYKEKFLEKLNDDLGVSGALAVTWDLIKNENIPNEEKRATLLDFDRVLGLGLSELKKETHDIPENVVRLVEEREEAREKKDWIEADRLREEIKSLGFEIEDNENGPKISSV